MSNSYTKGARGENELGEILADNGYVWMRAPGSGTANRELPDLIAGKDGHTLVIEVKRWSNDENYGYLKKKEVYDLQHFAKEFGAEYYVAYRFDYGDWKFVREEQMKENKKTFRCEKDLNEGAKGINEVCQ